MIAEIGMKMRAGMAAVIFIAMMGFFVGARGDLQAQDEQKASKLKAWRDEKYGKMERYKWGKLADANSDCPKTCAGGKAIDNTVCSSMDNAELQLIRAHLSPETRVFQWGGATSSLYFAQCVKDWQSIQVNTKTCKRFSDLKPPNTRVYCFPAQVAFAEEKYRGYIDAVSMLDNCRNCVDVAIIDGPEQGACAIKILPHLTGSASVFVGGWGIGGGMNLADMAKVLDGYNLLEEVNLPHKGSLVRLVPKVNSTDKEKAAYMVCEVIPVRTMGGEEEDQGMQRGKRDTMLVDGVPDFGKNLVKIPNSLYDLRERPKSMSDWRNDSVVREWKQKHFSDIKNAPQPEVFGPINSYPCKSTCSDGKTQIENTLCPMMYPKEQTVLLSYLNSNSVVFEWGSGGSTIFYSQCVKSWTSIEHEVGWCHQMQRMVPPNTNVECIPIEAEFKQSFGSSGPGAWDGSKTEFKSYVNAAHLLGLCEGCVDVVIVDGRARADCALEVLPYLREDSILFIHDYVPERMGGTDQYDRALTAYDVIKIVKSKPKTEGTLRGGLAILKPKPALLKKMRADKSK